MNSVPPGIVFDMQTHVGHTSILFKKRNYHRSKVSNSPKILLTSVIIHPLTEHGRFNLLPKGILKSGDLISSALHCQSCQVQRARRKERLLSRPSGGGEDRREEWSRKGRRRDGVKLNENPIFCIGKSFDGRERPFSRSLHRTWQRKHKTRLEDIVACPL